MSQEDRNGDQQRLPSKQAVPGSLRALRERIRRHASADGPAIDAVDRAILRRVDAVAAAIRNTPPSPPPALETDAFLAGIYERATRGSAAAIGPSMLRRAFAPVAAPRDVAWVEPEDVPELACLLRDTPLASHAPCAPPRRHKGRPALVRSRRLLAGAAAIFVVTGAFAVFHGTSQVPELVFQSSDAPLSHDNCVLIVRDVAAR